MTSPHSTRPLATYVGVLGGSSAATDALWPSRGLRAALSSSCDLRAALSSLGDLLSRRKKVRRYLGNIEKRYGRCGRNCVTERWRRWKTRRKRRDGGGII